MVYKWLLISSAQKRTLYAALLFKSYNTKTVTEGKRKEKTSWKTKKPEIFQAKKNYETKFSNPIQEKNLYIKYWIFYS